MAKVMLLVFLTAMLGCIWLYCLRMIVCLLVYCLFGLLVVLTRPSGCIDIDLHRDM